MLIRGVETWLEEFEERYQFIEAWVDVACEANFEDPSRKGGRGGGRVGGGAGTGDG